MALGDMLAELQGAVPNIDGAYAKTLINEAWGDVRRLGGWSWQFGESGFTLPGAIGKGTVTLQFGSPLVTADAVATLEWLTPGEGSQYGSLLTQRQFRASGADLDTTPPPPFFDRFGGASTIYDIIALGNNGMVAYGTILTGGSGQTNGTYIVPILDTGAGTGATASITVASGVVTLAPVILTIGANYTNPYIVFAEGGVPATFSFTLFAVLTLNRAFTDPLTTLSGAPVTLQRYFIYQCYIVAPVRDFSRWLSMHDIGNSGWLAVRGDRREVGRADPQRQIFSNPDRLLALGQDERVGSSTPGWERFELWPGPRNRFLYQTWYLHFGADLVNLSDTLPIGIPESMVKAKARARCYEQAEANKDPSNPRGQGADFRFLMGAALKQYESELKMARLRDRDKVDIFVTTMTRLSGGPSSITTFDENTGGIRSAVGV
jgi:hypothetical protein